MLEILDLVEFGAPLLLALLASLGLVTHPVPKLDTDARRAPAQRG
jgi:hypothetical protein